MNRFLSFIVGLMGLLLITPDLSAQNGFEVRGTVTDQTGQPVIGATVLEKGTTNGLSTDIDGNYTLKVSSADAIIEVSCIGYKTVTFVAKTNPAKTVIQEDAMYLDDVVVIGYGTVKKSDMTGPLPPSMQKRSTVEPLLLRAQCFSVRFPDLTSLLRTDSRVLLLPSESAVRHLLPHQMTLSLSLTVFL